MNLWTVGCADPRLTAQARSPMDKPGKTPCVFPRLAHRSAAAHKLQSTPQQDRMNLISGNGETSSRRRPLAYSSPEAVQTTGTVAGHPTILHIRPTDEPIASDTSGINREYRFDGDERKAALNEQIVEN